MIQPEREHAFRRHLHFLASRQDLRGSTSSCAGDGSNGGALASASDRAQQCAKHSAAANHFSGALVLADAFVVLLNDVGSVHFIAASANVDGIEIERQLGTARRAAL